MISIIIIIRLTGWGAGLEIQRSPVQVPLGALSSSCSLVNPSLTNHSCL